jgi:hypothetical protein
MADGDFKEVCETLWRPELPPRVMFGEERSCTGVNVSAGVIEVESADCAWRAVALKNVPYVTQLYP